MSVGTQFTLALLIVCGPVGWTPAPAGLMRRAAGLTHPESDIPIYIAGMGATLLLALLRSREYMRCMSFAFRRPTSGQSATADGLTAPVIAAGLQISLAFASLACFFVILVTRYPIAGSGVRTARTAVDLATLLLPAVIALVCASFDLRYGFRTERAHATSRKGGWGLRAMDVALPTFIFAAVFLIPSSWPGIAGKTLHDDSWNYFAMGPALAFRAGGALATEYYSQYGMGWPVTFVAMERFIPLSYANLIGVASLFGCIYYIALYGFLRMLVRNECLSAFGALLAVFLQLFCGQDVGDVMWMTPSSTPMRHPLDVALFAAMLMHLRSGAAMWLAACGAIIGIALVFELDTGVYLPVVLAFYGILRSSSGQRIRQLWGFRSLTHVAIVAVPAAMLFLTGLGIGSRGTLFHSQMWYGLGEGLRWQAFSGLGMLPISGNDVGMLILFALMIILSLSTVTWGVIDFVFADERTPRQPSGGTSSVATVPLLAAIGAYGLCMLLLFVGRSHAYNLFHPSVPFAILVTAILAQARLRLEPVLARTAIPGGILIVLLVMLVTKPDFTVYPGLVGSWFVPKESGGFALKDQPLDLLVGSPPTSDERAIKTVSAVVRQLSQKGTIAVLDAADTTIYYLSGVRPWSRYTSIFEGMLTQDLMHKTCDRLLAEPPDFVVMRAGGAGETGGRWDFSDVWEGFHSLVVKHYVMSERVGCYEIWRRSEGAR